LGLRHPAGRETTSTAAFEMDINLVRKIKVEIV
jgi:hypothetical protein